MNLPTYILLALSTTLATAQFSGIIFFAPKGKCPDHDASEKQTNFDYDPQGGNMCFESGYSATEYCVALSGGQVGADGTAPKKLGGCPTSSCDERCQTVDIERTTDGIYVDCARFRDAPYLYLGE